MLAILGGTVAVLSLLAVGGPPQANGLGLSPATVALVEGSGVDLGLPAGSSQVSRAAALTVAARQGRQDQVATAFLAEAQDPSGGPLGSRPRLCWVVLLEANPDSQGNLPAPGQIELYLVLVDAHSGHFVEGLIAFRGSPHTGVGSE